MSETADNLAPLEELAEDDDSSDDGDGGEAAGGHVCPECGTAFGSPLALGAHRVHKHGVRGKSETSQRERERRQQRQHGETEPAPRKRGRPRKTDSSSEPAAAPSESGRQARRRRAVKETLLELVSFTDEARGRADGQPTDLADVIRRDADKMANSIAWIAERFLPLGRAIDLAFGHGGLLTVARGFLGVGTWSLAHWRTLIQERQQQQADLVAEGQTAEQIAEEMQRAYLG